jgi:hypothetical protein
MRLHSKLAVVVGIAVLGLIPSLAMAAGPTYHPGGPHYTPSPGPGPAPHGKAYGFYCQGKSKKHVKGEKGTEFSRCVKAMARAAKNPNLTPKKACKGLSKKHVKGKKGTEFSRCVVAAAKLRHDERQAAAAV